MVSTRIPRRNEPGLLGPGQAAPSRGLPFGPPTLRLPWADCCGGLLRSAIDELNPARHETNRPPSSLQGGGSISPAAIKARHPFPARFHSRAAFFMKLVDDNAAVSNSWLWASMALVVASYRSVRRTTLSGRWRKPCEIIGYRSDERVFRQVFVVLSYDGFASFSVASLHWISRFSFPATLSTILRSSTSNLNSLGCSLPLASASICAAKSMRPVGSQSRFITPWYGNFFRLGIICSIICSAQGGISHGWRLCSRSSAVVFAATIR